MVHKLFRIQSIAPQPFAYFEGIVSKATLDSAKAKQAGPKRTWYTLTLEGLNGVLHQVICSPIPL